MTPFLLLQNTIIRLSQITTDLQVGPCPMWTRLTTDSENMMSISRVAVISEHSWDVGNSFLFSTTSCVCFSVASTWNSNTREDVYFSLLADELELLRRSPLFLICRGRRRCLHVHFTCSWSHETINRDSLSRQAQRVAHNTVFESCECFGFGKQVSIKKPEAEACWHQCEAFWKSKQLSWREIHCILFRNMLDVESSFSFSSHRKDVWQMTLCLARSSNSVDFLKRLYLRHRGQTGLLCETLPLSLSLIGFGRMLCAWDPWCGLALYMWLNDGEMARFHASYFFWTMCRPCS